MEILSLLLLISFFVVVLRSLKERNNQNHSNPDPYSNNTVLSSHTSTNQILVLVINVLKEEIGIIEKLRRKKIDFDDTLYQNTESLWYGSEKDFERVFRKFFNSENSFLSQGNESEYDVYFVKIKLKQEQKGFLANAEGRSRINAFRKLPEIAETIEVSSRLSVEAYQNTGVYRC